MMIMCSDYWHSTQMPKYLWPVADMMGKVDGQALLNIEEMNILKEVLNKALEEVKINEPKSTARIDFCGDLNRDGVTIQLRVRRDAQFNVARICCRWILGVLRYNASAGDFFDVSEVFKVPSSLGQNHRTILMGMSVNKLLDKAYIVQLHESMITKLYAGEDVWVKAMIN